MDLNKVAGEMSVLLDDVKPSINSILTVYDTILDRDLRAVFLQAVILNLLDELPRRDRFGTIEMVKEQLIVVHQQNKKFK
jgi:hypothetical protein